MSNSYKITSTSNVSAKVDNCTLSESKTTRKLLAPELIENSKNTEACVKMTIFHQRKSNDGVWDKIPSPSLSTLKANEIVKMSFDSSETLKLYNNLQELYTIKEKKGIPSGENKIIVGYENEIIETDHKRATVIKTLLEKNYTSEIWEELIKQSPNLADTLSETRLRQKRLLALGVFKDALNEKRDESFWQLFFETNDWILGLGLKYHFLKIIKSQPNYGGTGYDNSGAQKGDFLTHTEAEKKYTVLIEIKRPDTPLLSNQPYRGNQIYSPSSETSGGVAQIQSNCRKWEKSGSGTEENQEALQNIMTIQPKGILIIGQQSQLDNKAKQVSFELLRRNITNPEIITFDELFERANFLLGVKK